MQDGSARVSTLPWFIASVLFLVNLLFNEIGILFTELSFLVFKFRAAVRLTLLPRLPSLPILFCLQPHTLKPLWDSMRIISYLRSTSVVPISALGDSWSVGRTIPTVKTSLSSKSPVNLHWLHPLFLLLHLSWSKSGCLLKVLSWLMYPYSLQDYFLLSLTVCIPSRALHCSVAVM